ncbi:hypothetical protein [Actinomadura sp. CNU-125]|uniref:hypothetical protein n=1 Tax=Actinomadura sp. CNU-125 TaxID=1904961 RepID=UPI001177565A|nr:hypothetical protein [Actinomadura sp. CNU-125]
MTTTGSTSCCRAEPNTICWTSCARGCAPPASGASPGLAIELAWSLDRRAFGLTELQDDLCAAALDRSGDRAADAAEVWLEDPAHRAERAARLAAATRRRSGCPRCGASSRAAAPTCSAAPRSGSGRRRCARRTPAAGRPARPSGCKSR